MSASIILLCEDQRTDIFVRRFLKHRNFDLRDIYTIPLPTKGSGEQWVREQYPKQLRHIRGKRKVLLVVTDADANTHDGQEIPIGTSVRHRGNLAYTAYTNDGSGDSRHSTEKHRNLALVFGESPTG